MFPGRPVPQQQNPWELAPEVYVARGRNLGRDEGYQQGRNAGWNQAVRQANQVIEQQQQMIEDLQQQVQARMDVEESNQQVLLVRIYLDSIETLSRENPGAKKAILRAFKKHYLHQNHLQTFYYKILTKLRIKQAFKLNNQLICQFLLSIGQIKMFYNLF